MQPVRAVVEDAPLSRDARDVVDRIRRFVHGRPDLMDLLAQQGRLFPARVFGPDLSAAQVLEIYLEEHMSFFEIVRPYLRRGLRVLEVGGGFGFFHVMVHGAGAEIVSVEPSDAGFSLVRALALPVITELTREPQRFLDSRVEALDAPPGSFDLVVSNNVLEHVGNVAEVSEAMYRLTAPDGIQVHHCPNYLFPYEPHYKVPVIPCAVAASGRIFWRGFRGDPLWHSLNSINSLRLRRLVGRLPGASLHFTNATAFTLRRLVVEEHLAARHGWLTRVALFPPVRSLLTSIPPMLMSPMIFEIRKSR